MSKGTKSAALSSANYVHLHNHTQYSLLDGLTKVPDLIKHVKDLGMSSVAMTDHGTLSGLIDFYKEANKEAIKPIFGMEAYVASRTIHDRDPSKDKQYYHLIILAMNIQGYQNLMRLSTIANLEGIYYKPRIDHTLLEKYSDGLIILSGCIGGEVGDALRNGQYAQAKKTAEWYKSVFGDRYYLEVQDHGHRDHPARWDQQTGVNDQILKLSSELAIPAVVTCDAHYLKHEDQDAHEILLCVQTGSFVSDTRRLTLKSFELHVTDPKEIIARWGGEYPDLITNTGKIAERCSITLELGKILIPKFPVPKGESEKSYLHTLVYQGLAWRYGGIDEEKSKSLTIKEAMKSLADEALERVLFELGVVDTMGFNGYFLIISDFIGWGKDQGIVFGPGRGSAAGSIIAYALKITDLDPLKYDLLFERFLNPDRISMPDIDIDIQDTRRDEVIQYCVEKYGKERVANIVTFGRMAARNAVKDVARVLEVPYSESDRISKMIPPPVQGRHIPLAVSLQTDPDLKREYDTNAISKKVFDLAVQVEGTIRSHGVHAAGVVIAPDDIVKFVPLEMASKGVVATQYPMGPIEELGLLKMDFLGLSNLTTINNALRIIRKVYGDDINISDLPLNDKKTFELLARGDTTGVFQLESAGMKRYLKELKPSVFEDIVAMVALYRPGPMQFIDDFIKRKHGEKAITYMHQAMEPALKNTYGVLVYQEQVMQISKELCGFTGGQADTLRKAIGKKQVETMAKMKTAFIDGAVKVSGANRSDMERFWKQLEDFAAYCFNKSHAACYAMIAYQTAYLKAHYPSAFMAALMTGDFDDTDRLSIEISECKHMGLDVMQPDINESFVEFSVVKNSNKIRFGMAAIKNVGTAAVEEILRARKVVGGEFKSLEEYASNVSPRTVNRKALESLVKAGAFDRFGDRNHILSNVELLLKFSDKLQKEVASGQTDLFGALIESGTTTMAKLTMEPVKEVFSLRDQLKWERELLGIYLSTHPLEAYEAFLAENALPLKELVVQMEGKSVTIGGTVSESRSITTKTGNKMAFVKFADRTHELEAIVFPKIFIQNQGLWERDMILLITGKVSCKDRDGNLTSDIKITVDSARELSHEEATAYVPSGKKPKSPKGGNKSSVIPREQRLYLRVIDKHDHETLKTIKGLVDRFRGEGLVPVLVMGSDDDKQVIKLPLTIRFDEEVMRAFTSLLGTKNAILH